MGALATLVIVGGVVVVNAASAGPMGMMGGGMMSGMGMMGDMDEMHEDCKRMMEEHANSSDNETESSPGDAGTAASAGLLRFPLG